MAVLPERLARVLALTDALAEGLSADQLALRNGAARSNTIGAQFWCLVGARESYARAFEAGAWRGFACSLDDTGDPAAVRGALVRAGEVLLAKVAENSAPDAARQRILLDLIEHEAQHHGQLIRYFYANDLPFPPAFAERYAL